MYKFEDKIEIVDREIAKRRKKWQLSALADLDYDDVSQIIRLHIYNKWHLWDQSKPLENWLNRVIKHQILNLIRNNYGNAAPPCHGSTPCPADQGGNLCGFTPSGVKCSECPLYEKWEKTKQVKYNIKLASSIDHPDFVENVGSENEFDLQSSIKRLHCEMEKVLTPYQYKVYRLLFIENRSEEEVAILMGYKTTEKNRNPGYKQLHNVKKVIVTTAKELISTKDIIYV